MLLFDEGTHGRQHSEGGWGGGGGYQLACSWTAIFSAYSKCNAIVLKLPAGQWSSTSIRLYVHSPCFSVLLMYFMLLVIA